ncbi:50S ribosomal protein L6 [Candidatus Omnitrophota bacterium]
MSRIGKKPIDVPKGVKAAIKPGAITIEGPKGKLDYQYPERFKVELKDEKLFVSRPSDIKQDKAFHGLIRSLINNMIIGVTQGYSKQLELSGVGFKAQVQGKALNLTLSTTHPISYKIPDGITIEAPKPNQITVKGIDKAKVGEVAAEIRFYYEPEPYKGKGIKYAGEVIRRKAGKTVAGTGA